jgi:NADH-quinone oxidoreductase subunit A
VTSSLSLFFYALLVAGTAAAIILVSHYLGKRPLSAEKTIPYECGMDPVSTEDHRFSVKFFTVALLFVIFDVETVFIYLWAVSVRHMGIFGLLEMFVFIGILLAAFAYVWKKGGLTWE